MHLDVEAAVWVAWVFGRGVDLSGDASLVCSQWAIRIGPVSFDVAASSRRERRCG